MDTAIEKVSMKVSIGSSRRVMRCLTAFELNISDVEAFHVYPRLLGMLLIMRVGRAEHKLKVRSGIGVFKLRLHVLVRVQVGNTSRLRNRGRGIWVR